MILKSIIHTPAGKSDIIKKTLNTMRIDNMSKIDNASAYDSGIYDSNIVNVLPYYTEFHAQVMDLVKTMGLNAPEWLDTGCGTGTLALRALSENNRIRFTLADPSAQMLEQARAKIGDKASYVNCGSHELSFENKFDVVTAIQSHHYYDKPGREQAVKHCYDALKEGGVFVTFENIKMSTEASDAIGLKRWENFLSKSFDEEEVKRHIDRRGVEVFPITIEEHLKLLKECGFTSVNVLWQSYLQAGFWAIK